MAGECDQNRSNNSGCDNVANKSDGTKKLESVGMRWLRVVQNNVLNDESRKRKNVI